MKNLEISLIKSVITSLLHIITYSLLPIIMVIIDPLLLIITMSIIGNNGSIRQWPEVSDFVARFCTLRESENTRTCENRTLFSRNVQKSVTQIIYLGPLPRVHYYLL